MDPLESLPSWEPVPAPPLYIATPVGTTITSNSSSSSERDQDSLKSKRAWVLAKSPLSKALMTGFMVYMYARSLNMFSLIIIGTTFTNAINSISSINTGIASSSHFFLQFFLNTSLPKFIYSSLSSIIFFSLLFQFLYCYIRLCELVQFHEPMLIGRLQLLNQKPHLSYPSLMLHNFLTQCFAIFLSSFLFSNLFGDITFYSHFAFLSPSSGLYFSFLL